MNQNKRFTRSTTSTLKNIQSRSSIKKQRIEVQSKVNSLIQQSKFEQALEIVNKVLNNNDHWVNCKKAQIQFQIGHKKKSLALLRLALNIDRDGCHECLKLLLNLIQKNRPKISKFRKDVEQCLGYQDLSSSFRQQFLQIYSQLSNQDEQINTDNQKFANLTKHYQSKGLKFRKIEIVQVSNQYRVAKAKTNIKPNQTIVFVPEKQMITLQLAKSLQQVNKLSDEQSRLRSPKHCLLSIFLLIHLHRGESSPYYHYIQCLPQTLDNFPVYYTEDEYKQLEGTYFLSMVKRKKVDIKQDYQQILKIVPSLKNMVTYQKFVWARMIISSRIFGVLINGNKTDALVPIADMLNHKTPKTTSWYFCDVLKGFVIQNSGQQIQKGEQIFDSYGSKCNSRFLLNYGFTIPNNQHNQVMICLRKYKKKRRLPPNIRINMSIQSDEFRTLLSYYRQCLNEYENRQQSEQDESKVQHVQFISNSNQCQVWRLIHQTFKQQLEDYLTTTKMDERILSRNHQLSTNVRNCIQIRLGQKRVLQFYIKMAKKMITYYSSSNPKKIDVSEYDAYIRDTLFMGSLNYD